MEKVWSNYVLIIPKKFQMQDTIPYSIPGNCPGAVWNVLAIPPNLKVQMTQFMSLWKLKT